MNAMVERLVIDYMIRDDLIKKGKYKGEAKKHLDEMIIEHKRKYRSWLKRKNSPKYLYQGKDGKGYGEIVNGGGNFDSFWQKIFFPNEHWSDEKKKEFIDENWKRPRYSAYDCTGDIFTWAIDVFNTPKGVIAYIREAIDC